MPTATTTLPEMPHELQAIQPPASLQDAQQIDNTAPNPEPPNATSLPPIDTGLPAWRLLLSAFVFEALLWGFPLSYGVFQNYYSHVPAFAGNPFLSVVGSIASGISYLAAPIMIPITKRYAHRRRAMIMIGWPVCILGLVAGSFAKNLGSLIFTQGVMYGVGFVVFYYPILSFVNEFWVERRGMAYGLLCSASGVSGAGFPFAIERLLERYGYQTTLRAIAIGLAVLTGPLIPFLKGRIPVHQQRGSRIAAPGRTDWTFLRKSLFWTYSVSNLAMGFGYFFPALYLPSYATSQGLSSTQGALLLALMSVSQVLGQLSFGWASDHASSINSLAMISPLIAAVMTLTTWGLARQFSLLAVFAIFYGFFGAGYTALWGRMGMSISTEPSAAFASFGLLNFGKGVGNVLSGPIGGALLSETVRAAQYGAERYERIIVFTGTCMAVSAATMFFSCARPMQQNRL